MANKKAENEKTQTVAFSLPNGLPSRLKKLSLVNDGGNVSRLVTKLINESVAAREKNGKSTD